MGKRGEITQADVLGILRQSSEPLSAYDVIAHLREKNPKIAPPTVYRALSALMDAGHVHRLESMNAFVACQHDCGHDIPVLSVCDDCGSVGE